MKKRGLSFGSVLTILLTAVVLAGCVMVYSAFHSDADVPMRAQKMAGLLSDTFMGYTPQPIDSNVVVTSVTQAPQLQPSVPPVAPTPTAAPENQEITITLAGLASFDSNISASAYNRQTTVCEFQPVFNGIAAFSDVDVCIAALPQTLDASEKQYTDDSAQPSAALALRAAGFDTVVLSPDAMLKEGAQTVADTANALYQNGLVSCGVNAEQAAQLQWIIKGNIKVALIGYAESLSTKAANTLQTAAGFGMLPAKNMAELVSLITQARTQGANCVLVYYFWQDTEVSQVTEGMRKAALEVTAAGGDIIVGVGVKRLLPAAWLSTSDNDGISRRALVLYSLGSIMTESREAYDIAGALVHVKLKQQGNGMAVAALSYTPTYIWKQTIGGKEQYQVIRSDQAPPAQMNENQQGVMSRSLERTNESLQDTLKLFTEE